MSAATEFAVMRWLDDGNRLSVHATKYVIEPKQQTYKPGDTGLSVFKGYPGKWKYRVLYASNTKKEAELWLRKNQQELLVDVTDSFCNDPPTNANDHAPKKKPSQSVSSALNKKTSQSVSSALNKKTSQCVSSDEKVQAMLNMAKEMPFATKVAETSSANMEIQDLDESSDEEEEKREVVTIDLEAGDAADCYCLNCPYKEKVRQLEEQLMKPEGRGTMTAGVYSEEECDKENLVEIVPNTGVAIPKHLKAVVFSNCRTRKALATNLFRAFYTSDDMVKAKSLNNLKDSDRIIPAVISCAMRFKSELKPVTAAQLKKALHNAVSYEIRDKSLMNKKRKAMKEREEDHYGEVQMD
ncbi:uncharacterized protein LOC132744375 [Ruditapes philippinarum]|uniref:uncharacterized protein LOC132744375 n=1 Tax=Ruditapes philippinarum TaxID=129788 RepID=UPI00295AEAC3|nr:uncharacterized protein LOC132744375 [Ruditapes philippinarum]